MKKLLLLLLIALLLVLGVWIFLLGCRRSHAAWDTLLQYRYAHRGLHEKPAIPENSLAAFRRAVEHGYGAELDVHLMKDGNLAVIHDSSLLRTAGVDVPVESLTREALAQYRLEGTNEPIPLLPEVLELFEGKTPLIVELKPVNGNHQALSQAVAEVLDSYQGDYCIESFDPFAVQWFRENRPEVCRGQLSYDFLGDETSTLSWPLKFAMTHLLTNFLTQPDFVAYKYDDRANVSLNLCRLIWQPKVFHWTIGVPETLEIAEGEGATCIFEGFLP